MPLKLRYRTAARFELPGAGLKDWSPFAPREGHEDPEWTSELCKSLHFHELFRYVFKKPGHINVNEARVYKTWVKSLGT